MNLKSVEPYSRGDTIDQQYLVDDIKRGNMGVVYLCTHVRTNEPIAIKTFDSRFLNSEANRRNFLNEASTWIHLERHPNIVEARFLKMIDDHPYLFLERVIADNPRGATLKDLFFTQTIDYRSMLQIAIHICDGMIHALNRFPNLVHRDLKSENILIGTEGLPKVSDFGMTMRPVLENAEPRQNQYDLDLPFHPSELARRMEGTPAYASPEQCQCQPLDTRSDIYSFGCILYHMTTRHLPFHRNTVEETIISHIRETPVSPIERNKIIPRDFSNLIVKCLEKNPRNRFDSFDSIRMALIDLYEFTFYERPNSFQTGVPLKIDEYIERAKSFALLFQYEHGRSELMKAIRLDPARSEIYYLLGQYSYMEGQYNRAILELKEAARVIRDDAGLYELLGKTYQALSYNEEAIIHFRESIRISPERDSSYHHLIALLLKRNQEREAETVIQKALLSCKDQIPFLLRLAKLYERIGRRDDQYEILEKVVHLNPQQSESLLRLAELCLETKRNHQAREWVERVMKLHPKSFHELYRLGLLYIALKNPRRAAEVWKNAAMTGEGNGGFYLELAALFNSMRNYEEAWQYVLRAEEKGEEISSLKFEIQARRLKGR